MRRDDFVRALIGLGVAPLAGCAPKDALGPDLGDRRYDPGARDRLRPLEEWRTMLPPDQYAVLFEEWTEPPGSSALTGEKRPGTYLCGACFIPLFGSDAKYDSGTGWPTFWGPLLEPRIGFSRDLALPVERTEYHCTRCGGHHGHLFDDGPQPTGMRYCNNGLALRFVPSGEPLPDWR